MNEDAKKLSLEELATNEKMTVRTFNILKFNDLDTLEKILLHYNEIGNFKILRNCGKKVNDELISICIKYNEKLIVENIKKSKEEEIAIKKSKKEEIGIEESKDELQETIESLNFR